MEENSCFASLLVIQPGVSYGNALIDAASSALLLPSRRWVDAAEREPRDNSDFHQFHRLIRASSLDLGDRRIFFPAKATIKRRPRFTMDLDGPDAFPASNDSTTISIQDLLRHFVPAHDEPC